MQSMRKGLAQLEERSVQIAVLFEAGEQVGRLEAKRFGVATSKCSVDLIPGDGSGDRRGLPTAPGGETDRRLVLLVLAPIHQYPALTVLASHVGYHELRVVGFHPLGEVERERLRVV